MKLVDIISKAIECGKTISYPAGIGNKVWFIALNANGNFINWSNKNKARVIAKVDALSILLNVSESEFTII